MFAVKASVVLATFAAAAPASSASPSPSAPARALRGLGASVVHDEANVSEAEAELKRIFSGKACEGEASEDAKLACFKKHLAQELPQMLQSLQAEEAEEAKLEEELKQELAQKEGDAFASSRLDPAFQVIMPASQLLNELLPDWWWTPFKTVRKSLVSAGQQLVNWVADGATEDSEHVPTTDGVLTALETFGKEFGDGFLNMVSFGNWKPCGEGDCTTTTPAPETETEGETEGDAAPAAETATEGANTPAPETTTESANTPAKE